MKLRSWIRLYTEIPDDPKVQALPAPLFKFWINCLCIAGRNDGWLPPDDSVGWALREKPARVGEMKRSLVAAGLIDETPEGGFRPHSWNVRQYETDVSSNRVKRFRERSMKREETVSHTVSASVSDSVSVLNLKPEENTKRAREKVSEKPLLSRDFPQFWQRWCELTKRKQKESGARTAWISVVEPEFAPAAMACLERYGASDEVSRGVVANPDNWIYSQARDNFAGEWQQVHRNGHKPPEPEYPREIL